MLVLGVVFGSPGFAAEPGMTDSERHYLGFIPFVSEHPCVDAPYWQYAVSLPLQGTSDGGEGHPWRAMYGLCVAESGRFTLHQDWVVSYLDAEPVAGAPGGDGAGFGTDFSVQWRHRLGGSLTPYYELGGGIQYAAITPFPAHGSRWTFTINAGAGVLIPIARDLQLNTAVRYLHMSNGGLFPDNAGYDAFHLILGLRWTPAGAGADH